MPRRLAPHPRDQRSAARFDTTMPMRVGGRMGRTQNISAQGVYFETSTVPQLGSLVNLSLEFKLYGRTHRLQCEGKVVRVEPQGGKVGVAARLLAPFFEGEEEAPAPPLR